MALGIGIVVIICGAAYLAFPFLEEDDRAELYQFLEAGESPRMVGAIF